MFARTGRILCGFIAQYIGVAVSVNAFATSGGPIFWWTQSAITIAAMLLTPDKYWPECVVHVASGIAAYVPFRYKTFSVPLLATICASNASGQFFGYLSMKRFYPALSPEHVGTLRFLGIFLLFPVILASVVASIPGSLGFYFLGTDVTLSSVIVNYTLGHISGTVSLLYPLLIAPIMWKVRVTLSCNLLMHGASVFLAVTLLCMFTNYYLFGFATIIAIFGLFIGISAYMDQCTASLIQLVCTCSILGLTADGRGPFVFVAKESGVEAVLIGTQMAITALVATSAFIVILVSQLRALETSAKESRRQSEELAVRQTLDLYRIGHDLKNNSTLVRAICEVGTDDRKHETLDMVSAINLLNDVLVSDMVDMVSGKSVADRVISREDVDVDDVVKIYTVVTRGLLLLEGKQSCIMVQSQFSSSGKAIVYTNMERLHQIICNLVSNAVKYTDCGEIILGVDDSSESCIKIHVEDSGVGMSEVEISKVFDLFFRSERVKKVNSGAGIGLANVRTICNAIDVKLDVTSSGEGEGSTFTLTLPRTRNDDDMERQKTTHFSFRVLVVDDSVVIHRLMTKYLMSLGCVVEVVSSAEESRIRLREDDKDKFDVVIIDNFMGNGESGMDFIRSVRKGGVHGASKLLPCILCSGEYIRINEPKTLAITKPFSSDDIATALNILVSPTHGDLP
jgi:signal transduction histidine kinase/CheY-like chemotaxis protein